MPGESSQVGIREIYIGPRGSYKARRVCSRGQQVSCLSHMPPFVALAYCPLSWFNYRISYALHTLLMAGALILALWLCRPFSKQLRDYFLPATCLSLWFYPIFRAVTGGQNSTLSLLLIVLSLRAILAGRDWLAGIILGCLLFKPQFAVPLIGLNVLSRRFSVAGWSGVTALVLYSIGAMVSGPDWINNWLKFGWWFSEIDSGINYANSISWLGFFVAIFGHYNHSAMMIGWIIAFATAGCLCLIWGVMGRHVDIAAGWALALAGLPLLPPHAMYYEAGILLVPYFILLAEAKDKSLIYGLTFWALGFTQLLSSFMRFSPLFLLCLAFFILALYTLSQVLLSNRANKNNISLNRMT